MKAPTRRRWSAPSARAGGSLAAADLAAHTTVVRAPARGSYRGFELNMQPPVSQALIAARVLAAIERSGVEGRADRMHVAVEGIEAAFQDKHEIVPTGAEERLLSEPLVVDTERAQRRGGPEGGLHTTAVTAADSEGVVVSRLISVFGYFGSGVLVPEGGFLLNNRLSRASTDPESPNFPVGGRRPLHTLSPSLVVDGERVFALSTPGADGQVQTLVQTIDAIATDGDSIPEALDRPRWRSNEGSLLIEDDYDPDVAAELERRGHDLMRLPAGAPRSARRYRRGSTAPRARRSRRATRATAPGHPPAELEGRDELVDRLGHLVRAILDEVVGRVQLHRVAVRERASATAR